MNRKPMLREVERRLDGRTLVWGGLRHDDVEPLRDLPNLRHSFSIIGGRPSDSAIESTTHESLTGVRHDLERWSIDDHLAAPETIEFRRRMLHALAQESALLPYRPSNFLSAIWFARRDRCTNLGLFGGIQAAFEHKPWVETSVAKLGIETIPWTYVADEEQFKTLALLDDGPIVLRRSRTSGGEGFAVVEDRDALEEQWPQQEEGFASVAPLLEDAVPLNIGATVWRDGITVRHLSVQLIGVPTCVHRRFGYCGNDFAAARSLGEEVIDSVEQATRSVGSWLRSQGYLGTFGVDFLLTGDGRLVFTEVNPRFQGSTSASARLSIEADEPCLLLEHLAAMLGANAPRYRPVRDQVTSAEPLAQLVLHDLEGGDIRPDPADLAIKLQAHGIPVRADATVREATQTEVGAVLARVAARQQLTTSGADVCEPVNELLENWTQRVLADHERWGE